MIFIKNFKMMAAEEMRETIIHRGLPDYDNPRIEKDILGTYLRCEERNIFRIALEETFNTVDFHLQILMMTEYGRDVCKLADIHYSYLTQSTYGKLCTDYATLCRIIRSNYYRALEHKAS